MTKRYPGITAEAPISRSRRRFMIGTAGLGAFAATMPISHAIWASNNSTVRVRARADLDTLDPAFYQNTWNIDAMSCLYSKLIRFKPSQAEWEWELEAAESIEQVDDTHIRFRLREGIMFTNGYGEMTAEDVKFSLERVLDHDSPVKGDLDALDHVEVEDDYTGVIVLERPFAPIWNVALPWGVGHIVSRDAVMEKTGDGSSFGMEPPAFSGPYILEEWRPDERARLVPNPDYTGPDPASLDEIRIIPMGDRSSAETAYEAGDIDYTLISLSTLGAYRQTPPADTAVEEFPSSFYYWIGMNTDNPALQDINVRRAVQWAIDINQILALAFHGEAEPATGLIAPGLLGHREQSLIPPEGDVDRAREYLEEAGVSDLQLRVDTLNDPEWRAMAEVLQAQLGRIGIDVSINVREAGEFWTIGMEDEGDQWQDVQIVLNRFAMAPDPYYATQWFTTEQVGVWNWERFSNEEFDQLNREAVTETDEERRAEMYRRMQEIMEESGAYRFMTHGTWPVVYRESKFEAAHLPDGQPRYRFFESV